MPICKLCNSPFPFWKVIDGKSRHLGTRKYCLICSPWGKGNTRQLHIMRPVEVGKKRCPRCLQEKDESEFYKRRDGSDFSSYCKVCNVAETVERQTKFKRQCVEYMGGKCELCEYNRYYGGLDFHHLDPTKKDFGIGKAKLTSFSEKVKRELDKCVIVCCRCHREIHAGLHDNFIKTRCAGEMEIIRPCEG